MIAALLLIAADAPTSSWGKPGVTLESYRADANLCASRAWNTDIEDTEAVAVFRQGTRQIDALSQTAGAVPIATADVDGGGATIDSFELNRQTQIGRIVEGARPRERYAEVRERQQATLGACLRSLGYVRFALTDGQKRRLKKLKRGSSARHAYLHALASDPAILAAQKVSVVSRP